MSYVETIVRLDQNEDGVLVVNAGSSSVKWAAFSIRRPMSRLSYGAVENIGGDQARIYVRDADGKDLRKERQRVASHAEAFDLIGEGVRRGPSSLRLKAIAHRIVHDGGCGPGPIFLDSEVEHALAQYSDLAPLHQPHGLGGVVALRRAYPQLPQIGCFDTDFHRDMPRVAQMMALPRAYFENGVSRVGYHGLSYEFVLGELKRENADVAKERIIIAHLGGGSSMCAIHGGRSIETTMGFSTLSGLPMSTRSGDLDPGIILHLAAANGLSIERITRLLYEESGMLGVSHLTGDMKKLLDCLDQPTVREAVDLYCYHGRLRVAGLTGALSGIDRLVFTGGIGANAPLIRSSICAGLGYLGIVLDSERNSAGERVISSRNAASIVQIIATNEEAVIARHAIELLASNRTLGVAGPN